MAGQDDKITQLTELTSASADDLLPIVNDPSGTALTQKITVDDLFNYLSAVGTNNNIAKFGLTGLEDSSITDDGTTVAISSDFAVDTNLIFADASANRVGINKVPTQGSFDVSGDGYFSGRVISNATNQGFVIQDLADLGGWAEFRPISGGNPFIGNRRERSFSFAAYNTDTPSSGFVGIVASFGYDDGIDLFRDTSVTGDLAVDTDTLFVDASANRVGINKVPTQGALDVNGDTYIEGNLTIDPSANTQSIILDNTGFNNIIKFDTDTNLDSRLDFFENGVVKAYIGYDSSEGVLKLNGDGVFSSSSNLAIDSSGNLAVDTDTLFVDASADRVGIGTATPQTTLDINTTTGAVLVPRLTTTQRNALTAVAGMIIYNTTTGQHEGYDGAWNAMY